MSVMISVLAGIIALIAVWLASETLNKLKAQNFEILKAHIHPLQASLTEHVKELNNRLSALDRELKELKQARAAADKAFATLRKVVTNPGKKLRPPRSSPSETGGKPSLRRTRK